MDSEFIWPPRLGAARRGKHDRQGRDIRFRRAWRPRQRPLGFGNKLRLMASDEEGAGREHDDHDGADDDHDRPGGVLHFVPEQVGGEPEHARPGKGADDVGEQKLRPRHAIGAGQQADDAAQHRHKAGDKDDHAAVAQEQILAELDAAFGDVQVRTEAQQQPITELSSDDEADHLANESCKRRRRHHREDVEIVFGAGKDAGQDQHRLAGKRQADALEADDQSDDDQAIDVNEMSDVVGQGGFTPKPLGGGRRTL